MLAPDIYDVEINYSCNNNCLACPKEKSDDFLSLDKLKDFADKNIKRDSRITLTGGEPTLHPDFIRITEYFIKSGGKVILLTNGRTFRDKNFVRTAFRTGLADSNIPLYGPSPMVHNRITQSPDSFQETCSGLKNLFQLKSTGYPVNIYLKILFCKVNVKFLPRTVQFVAEEFPQVTGLIFQPMYLVGRALKNSENLLVTLSESVPYLTEAVRIGLDRKYQVIFREIPLCIFPNPEFYYQFSMPPTSAMQSIYGPHRKMKQTSADGMTIKSPHCTACEADSLCLGVYHSYARLAGLDEFKPIKRLKYPAWLRGIRTK